MKTMDDKYSVSQEGNIPLSIIIYIQQFMSSIYTPSFSVRQLWNKSDFKKQQHTVRERERRERDRSFIHSKTIHLYLCRLC